VSSSAESPYTAVEAENGELAGNATVIESTTASGGEAVQFGSVASNNSPVDPNATTSTTSLLSLLYSMPGRGKVLASQQMGAQYTYYADEILPITNGTTVTDEYGDSQVISATNKIPAIINYDLDWTYGTAWSFAAQNPARPRTPNASWAYNGTGVDSDYGSPSAPHVDGATSQWKAGTLVSLTYHWDNPLTGGQYGDLSSGQGNSFYNISPGISATISEATTSSSNTINVANIEGSFSSSGGIIHIPSSTYYTQNAISSSGNTLTMSSTDQILIGTVITAGQGISNSATVSSIDNINNIITISGAGTLGKGEYSFSNGSLIQYDSFSGSSFTGCIPVIPGESATIYSGTTVVPAGLGYMTDTFFTDSASQAYANFQISLTALKDFCSAVQDIGGVVIYRMFHEPNGNWFWWCQGGEGSPGTAAPWLPAAFRFVQQSLWSAGVHNVLFVWGPIRSDGSATKWPAADMTSYPGDASVDIAGVDQYGENPNNSTTKPWQTSQAAIASARGWTIDKQKPFAIFEFGWINPVNDPYIYTSSHTDGEFFAYDNNDILQAIDLSTPGTTQCGPAYFNSWGQNWSIRFQNNLNKFYTSSSLATQSDVISWQSGTSPYIWK
jgi:hypothetical protein